MSDPVWPAAAGIGDELSEELRGRVKTELDPGERLLWAARPILKPPLPVTGFVAGGLTAALLLGVALVCFAFSLRDARPPGNRGEIPGTVGLGLLCFCAAVVVILGLWASVGQRRVATAKRGGTLYALTDRRAIIWSPERRGAVKFETVARGSITGVYRREFPDGTGDVLFRGPGYNPELEYDGPTGFESVADVRRVEEQVRRTLVDSGAPAGHER